MKKAILISTILGFYFNCIGQDVTITTQNPSLQNDSIKITPQSSRIAVPITLSATGTSLEVEVKIQSRDLLSAQLKEDYSFGEEKTPLIVKLNKDNNFTQTVDLYIEPNKEGEKTEVDALEFEWIDRNYPEKPKKKIILLEIQAPLLSRRSVLDSSNTNKLEFVQFTDFLGFQNDRPNGLLQQEFRFKWAIHRRMRPIGKNGTYYQTFRSLIFPDLLLNRIDKSKQEVDYSYPEFLPGSLPKDNGIRKLTTMDILKYTNMQIAARLVFFALHTKNFRVHLQTGVRMMRNRPFYTDTIKAGIDSGKVRTDFRSVYSFAPNFEVYAKVLNTKENGIYMDMILGIMRLRLKDGLYKQYDAAVVDEFNRATTLIPVSTLPKRKPSPILYTSARLAKDWGENKDNSLFFRINYFYQTGEYNALERQPQPPQPPVFFQEKFHNHFLQLQLGVSLGLDRLFKPNDEKKPDDKATDKNSSENSL